MATKVIPYLSFEHNINFLTTKSDEILSQPVFRLSFYVHIVSSWFVMALGIGQFVPQILKKYPSWHKQLGIFYVLLILVFASPSGLGLALFANGGLSAKVGFIMQCAVWWLTTYTAFYEAKQKRWQRHVEWMMRSYAVTLAAMSLRLYSFGMVYLLHTKPIETYLTVVWLSWIGNLVIVEVLIYVGVGKKLFDKLQNK